LVEGGGYRVREKEGGCVGIRVTVGVMEKDEVEEGTNAKYPRKGKASVAGPGVLCQLLGVPSLDKFTITCVYTEFELTRARTVAVKVARKRGFALRTCKRIEGVLPEVTVKLSEEISNVTIIEVEPGATNVPL
jgi:hypothetical protein